MNYELFIDIFFTLHGKTVSSLYQLLNKEQLLWGYLLFNSHSLLIIIAKFIRL